MLRLTCTIKNGRFCFNKEFLKAFIAKNGDGKYIMEIDEAKPIMSSEMRGKYWTGMVDPIALSTGKDRIFIHDNLKRMFLTMDCDKYGFTEIPSTRNLSDSQLADYHYKIGEWAAKHNIKLNI